jgi:uncharacterized protein (TIGR00255 family)
MTAFSRCVSQGSSGDLTWELRSVNHRFREVAMRLPEEFRFHEGAFRDAIASSVSRGRIDGWLRYSPPTSASDAPQIDTELIGRLGAWSESVRHLLPEAQPLRVGEILKWPGVMSTPAIDEEALAGAAMTLLTQALQQLSDSREREGEALGKMLNERVQAASAAIAALEAVLPEIGDAHRERLGQRLAEMSVQVDPERLEQEVVLLLAKSEVSEEVDRLKMHLQEVTQALEQNDPIGRRLDFLMQELNREANTLGSKSAHAEQTNASVTLKVLIEQMREQVQNIE